MAEPLPGSQAAAKVVDDVQKVLYIYKKTNKVFSGTYILHNENRLDSSKLLASLLLISLRLWKSN